MSDKVGGGDGEEKTLSQLFDETYQNYKLVINNDDNPTSSLSNQDRLYSIIKSLEQLTLNVSSLDMFSKNENYTEMDPKMLKFLLLPYLLGVCWQLTTREKRKEICAIGQVYFKDFLKRCVQYGLIKGSQYIQEQDDDDEEHEKHQENKIKVKVNQDEKRERKIHKFKQNKELDEKIVAYTRFAEKYDDDDSTTYSKEIYISLIKRAINDSEDQMESIEMELGLIKFHEAEEQEKDDEGGGPSTSKSVSTKLSSSAPLKPFIITKDAAQKAVYGVGYPSLPIMTVEELYQQRRETGEWGPPPTSSSGGGVAQINQVNEQNQEDEEDDKMKELLEEKDDEMEIARRRDYDEYKDDHRRGWGNRFNRS